MPCRSIGRSCLSAALGRSGRAAVLLAFMLLLLPVLMSPALAQIAVLTQHNDNSRTGQNLNEKILTASNVNATQFGKLFQRDVDGEVYAQPLYVSNVAIPGKGTHNVVYVATMNNTIYAFDADHAGQSTPLWSVNFGPTIPASDVQCCCPDISTKIGILGTPVIDITSGSPTANTIWFVARNKNTDGTYHQYLYALDITSGQQKGKTEIAATFGSQTFNPKIQNQRPALTLSNGVIYIGWSSHNDCNAYHGWVMGYNAATLQQVSVYCNTSTGSQGGIWMGGQGLTVDSAGNLYLMAGNGTFDANSGGPNIGCSVIKLSTANNSLQVADWFTPFDVANLNSGDLDLGSAGVLGLPGTKFIIGGGKEGKFYLMDTTNLGHFTSGSDNVAQSWQATSGFIFATPIYYNSPVNGPCIYVWSSNDTLRVYQYQTASNQFNTTPIAYSATSVPSEPGSMLSISANGSTPGTAILWANQPLNANANNSVVEGILRAYDASAISVVNGQPQLKEIWNSKMASRDELGNFAKFCAPTIANGRVYMATFGTVGTQGMGRLVVYGPIPLTRPNAPTLHATPGDAQVRLSWSTELKATSYNLYRATTSGGEGSTPYVSGLTTTSYSDNNVTNGTTYYYQVTAANSLGESARSKEVSATPESNLINPTPLLPTDNVYVRSGAYANDNFVSDPLLIVKINPPDLTRYTFVKFDLSGIKGTLKYARLRLYGARQGTNSTSYDSAYAVADTSWSQSAITWNTMPPLGKKLHTTKVTSTPNYYIWDVSNYVLAQYNAGVKMISLAVTMDSLPADGYRDNFNSTRVGSNPPQLMLGVTGN